jgi:hypothetical protein
LSSVRDFQDGAATVHPTLPRQKPLFQVICCACGIAVYHLTDWLWLQRAYAVAVRAALDVVESGGFTGSDLLINVASREVVVTITPGCTFVDFYLSLVPFALSFSKAVRDFTVLFSAAIAITAFNFLRLVLVLCLFSHSTLSWSLVHTVPTYGVWIVVSATCLILWFRSLNTWGRKSAPPTPIGASETEMSPS